MTLKDLRIAKNMTQTEMAHALKIPYGTYRQYEYGTTTPPVDVLRRMSRMFNITVSELLDVFTQRKVEADGVEATAQRWGVGINRVRQWCQQGKIEGAYLDKSWHIPLNAERPSGVIVKNQHYVFRKYLTAWADSPSTSSGRVYVYRKAPRGKQSITEKALLTKIASQKYYYDISNFTAKDISVLTLFINHAQKGQRITLTPNTDLLADEANARDFIEKYVMCPAEDLEVKNKFYERLRQGDYSFYKDSAPAAAIAKLREMVVNSIFDQKNWDKEAREIYNDAMNHLFDPDTKHDFNLFFWTQYLRTPKIHDAEAAVFEEFKAATGMEDVNTDFHVNLYLVYVAEKISFNISQHYKSAILLLKNKTNEPFITGDAPILNISKNDKKAYMYYPLAPDTAMILMTEPVQNATLTINDIGLVRVFNDYIMDNAVNEVYSCQPFKMQNDSNPHVEGYKKEKDYSYNTPANVIIKDLSQKLNISLADAEIIEKRLEEIGFIEISLGDVLIHAESLHFCFLTFNTQKGLSSTSRNPFNVVIKLKEGKVSELATVLFSVLSNMFTSSENKLSVVASLLSSVFSALSLLKVEFSENETAILIALDERKRRMNEEECYANANVVLRQYRYNEIDQNAFDRAVKNLLDHRCIEMIDGEIELCGEIHGTP